MKKQRAYSHLKQVFKGRINSESFYTMLSQTPELQYSGPCVPGIRADNGNRIENLETVPHKYVQEMLTKMKNQFNERSVIFSTNGAGKIRYP